MDDVAYVLHREVEAAKTLLAHYADVLADDDDAKSIAVETETNLHDAIGKALSRIKECDLMADAIGEHMKTLKARKDRYELQSERLRTAVGVAMETAQIKKVEHALGTVSVRQVPPSVMLVDESAIPARFWKQADPKPDKAALKKAIGDGEQIPGVTLSNGGTTISVKV